MTTLLLVLIYLAIGLAIAIKSKPEIDREAAEVHCEIPWHAWILPISVWPICVIENIYRAIKEGKL